MLRLLRIYAEQREDPLLHVGAVDPLAPRPELPAVEHQVVRPRPHRQRVGLQPREVVGVRGRERVMRGDRPAGLVEPLEQGELNHPRELEAFGHRWPTQVEP